jgi:hypothetical protein
LISRGSVVEGIDLSVMPSPHHAQALPEHCLRAGVSELVVERAEALIAPRADPIQERFIALKAAETSGDPVLAPVRKGAAVYAGVAHTVDQPRP